MSSVGTETVAQNQSRNEWRNSRYQLRKRVGPAGRLPDRCLQAAVKSYRDRLSAFARREGPPRVQVDYVGEEMNGALAEGANNF